jgi:choline dehydrogenase-like flavoprotein
MDIEDLTRFDRNTVFETDLVVVGGGPAGLTIAREFSGSSLRVLVLESGLLDETPDHAALTEGESESDASASMAQARRSGHRSCSLMGFAAARSADRHMHGPASRRPSTRSISPRGPGSPIQAGRSRRQRSQPMSIAPLQS